MKTLDELKLTDNTLVIFTSDNGGSDSDFKGTQNVKLNLASEAGDVRKNFMKAKADAAKMGHITNGPWRAGKGSPYEGGHRVPFIARWPGKILPATTSTYTCCLTDLLATAADIVGAKLPDNAAEDSFSRKGIFIQGDTNDNAIAICTGQWKMIVSTDKNDILVNQLYNLSNDPAETNDVSKEQADVVKSLAAELEKARTEGRTRK
jgi:arylsulfatase A-like enzyme